MLNAVWDYDTGELMEMSHLIKKLKYRELWRKSYGNELGLLEQGMPGRVERTDTIFFIDKQDIPNVRWQDVTYGRVVVNYRPKNQDPKITRLTVGSRRNAIVSPRQATQPNYRKFCKAQVPNTDSQCSFGL